jgi:uncharacterized protein
MKLIILTTAACVIAAPAFAQTYSIGSNPQGSSAYSTAAAVAKAANAKGGMRARVVPQGGPVVTLPLVNTGKLNFSIAVSVVAAFAHDGKAMFRGKPQKDVRIVAVLRTLRLGFFTRKDSSIKTIADLKGKKVPTGFKKQRIVGVFLRSNLAIAGLTMKDVTGVPVPNGTRSVEDLIAGKVDVVHYSMTAGKTRQAHASVGIRYISLPKTAAALAAMRKTAPGTIIETVNPGPQYPGITGPTNIMAAPFLLMASSKVSDADAYKIAKAMHGGKKVMVAAFKGMRGFNPDKMYVDLGLPYHPGALKFYKEKGQVK